MFIRLVLLLGALKYDDMGSICGVSKILSKKC